MNVVNICWFRRDLRLHDHASLYHALRAGQPVVPVFIFDRNILDLLENKQDRRVEFIHQTIGNLQNQLQPLGSTMEVFYGTPLEAFEQLSNRYSIQTVFTNRDYEPYAIEREALIKDYLQTKGIGFEQFKDHVIMEQAEVMKDDGTPYTVFTPYSKKWKSLIKPFHLKSYPTEKYFANLYQQSPSPVPALASMGFEPTGTVFPSAVANKDIVQHYAERRNFPAIAGTTRLSLHLRFGTISVRQLAREMGPLSETYLNELIWRDFYQMILWNFPQVGKGKAFKPAYDQIEWRNAPDDFERWCKGMTGYPIVDAGMRELNATGFMHNRVRMIVASFLTKHLLLDWRLGEAYFAQQLLDFDLAANNGGWQWASGSGCDAAPYFRIFNPRLQTEKFDPQLKYIRHWIPEFDSFEYPLPMVVHEEARKRCLEVYQKALNNGING